jgi:mRNA-degrading endonuclease toxin of MazEF toxin-antitoxin module
MAAPHRGEIWAAYLERDAQQRHWVLIVSVDWRNLSNNSFTVLAVPFASRLAESSTTVILPPGETGLPGTSCVRGHYISLLPKSQLIERMPRALSSVRMRDVSRAIHRSFDPDAP